MATLRLIADNISFLGGRLDGGRIAERADQDCWSWPVLVMVRSQKINSQSLEDTQVGYISQKYTLDKYTLEKLTFGYTL